MRKMHSKQKNSVSAAPRRKLPVISAPPEQGLTAAQAAERVAAGYANLPVEPPSKTVKEIILSNIFTWFNLIFIFLACCIAVVRSWYDLMFMGIVVCNTAIGIVQELRSKKMLDSLTLLSAPKGTVIRDGKKQSLPTDALVRDDIVEFTVGSQIYADAVVVSGQCRANEALITGESDEILKNPGDRLLSGSFLVAGSCRARLTAVGADSFVSRLTLEAKKLKKPKQSEMMRSLTAIVKWIGIFLIPFGALLFIKEIHWVGSSVRDGVVSTVGALIGMIPEGLYLLTSLALVAGVLRLSQRKTLVHEMGCIETLARVDTLCVDKTGTITENKMIVEDVVLLCKDRFIADDIRMIMADYVYAMKDDNDTMAALRRYFTGTVNHEATTTLPFTSAKKYGGVTFTDEQTYLLGAPDVILSGPALARIDPTIASYSAKGCRVLLLALYDGTLQDETLSAPAMPLALILLANKVRAEAPATFDFFRRQGVAVKVISGDNALTVSEVAKRAGIENAGQYVDARTLTTDRAIADAAVQYTVFGRVTPEQKRKLVRAMKAAGRTVAMTGDGVNDVLALKEADCSIAMASGSDVAAQVSHIVLLDSNFASMPSVVMEGRRVINNIERSASLFLVKNIYSFLLAVVTLFCTLAYPMSPSQLSLVNIFTIGIPSFVLALEPNESLVRGKFLVNVLYRALPAALADWLLVLGVLSFDAVFGLQADMVSTVCTYVMGIVGLMMLHRTCQPYNRLRTTLMTVLTIGFILASHFFKTFFTLAPLDRPAWLVLVVFALLAWPVPSVISRGLDKLKFFVSAKTPRRPRRREAPQS